MNKLLTLGLIAFTLPVALPANAQDTGAFLAMRQAARDSDAARLSLYLDDELKKTPDDPFLQEEAILSAYYELDLDQAVSFAEKLKAEGHDETLAVQITEFTQLIRQNQFAEAVRFIEGGERLSFIESAVIEAWAMVENGDTDAALKFLETTADENGEMAFIYDFQRAMIDAYANQDYGAALEIIEGGSEPLYMTGLSIYSHIALLKLSASPKFDSFMQERFGEAQSWPSYIQRLMEELEKGDTSDSLGFSSPQSAIAEFALAIVNASRPEQFDQGNQYLLYGLAPNLAPENSWFIYNYMNSFYSRASTQENYGNTIRARNEYGDIIKFYDDINRNSYVHPLAEQSYVNALFALNREDEVKKWARSARSKSADMIAFRADVYRRMENYPEAIENYEEAIALTGRNNPEYLWPIYGLAISYERSDNWPEAEKNFLDALKLDPENPDILNYLGYSYVDRGEKLDTGLEMIEKAVEIAPSQPHIIDSLGWAYFRLERYDEALQPLEDAASLLSTDPIINSHLGDLYWKLGREREARYQWKRSLGFLEEDTIDLTRAELAERLERGI